MSPEPSTEPAAYQASPRERVREQVALYEATDGREGGTLEDKPVVILTTVGAKTGAIRKTALMRVAHEGTYAVVASDGGATRHPSWYHNLLAHRDVRLQDGATVHRLRAREILGEEKTRWWRIAELRWPHFPEYRASAGRDIPVVLLEPADQPGRDRPIRTLQTG